MALLEICLFPFLFFEVYYLLRFLFYYVWFRIVLKNPANLRPIEKEGIVYGICSTNDLDMLLHMNNSRYLREMDFARMDFFAGNGLYPAIRAAGGGLVQSALSIRYRRAITILQVFRIRTKFLYWDDRSFYVEHRMETIHDNFVRAIAICKQTMVGFTVPEAFKAVLGHTLNPPAPSLELQKWIETNMMSSQRLQQELNLSKDGTIPNGSELQSNFVKDAENGSLKKESFQSGNSHNGIPAVDPPYKAK